MDPGFIRRGTLVRTLPDLQKGAIVGTGLPENLLDNRRSGEVGTVEKTEGPHGNELWAVRHNDGTKGIYHYDELRGLTFRVSPSLRQSEKKTSE